MIPKMRFGWARLPMLVAGVSVVSMLAAAAQTPQADDELDEPAAEETEAAPSVNDVDIMKDIDVSKLDWSLLNVDASTLNFQAPKGSGASKAAGGADTAWSANERANGTSAVSVKQSVTPFWDTRIGADMTVARQGTATTSEQLSEKLANGGSLPQSSGTAWAAVTAPGVASIWDKTSVEARVDPGSEQSKLGTSLSKSLPLGEQSGTQPRDRPVGEAQHCRHRHQPDRRADAIDVGRQMAAQGRRRAEAVRRRHHLRLDRRNAVRRRQQEPQRRVQTQLVRAGIVSI
jgi:hypothetical protein